MFPGVSKKSFLKTFAGGRSCEILLSKSVPYYCFGCICFIKLEVVLNAAVSEEVVISYY